MKDLIKTLLRTEVVCRRIQWGILRKWVSIRKLRLDNARLRAIIRMRKAWRGDCER